MATKTTKKVEEVKETKEVAKEEGKRGLSIALWKKTSKEGKKFLANNDGLIGFYNPKKDNPKAPDLRIFVRLGDELFELASLWCNVSEKTGNKYLTGKLVDVDELLTGK